jgi:hypothetical protein
MKTIILLLSLSVPAWSELCPPGSHYHPPNAIIFNGDADGKCHDDRTEQVIKPAKPEGRERKTARKPPQNRKGHDRPSSGY